MAAGDGDLGRAVLDAAVGTQIQGHDRTTVDLRFSGAGGIRAAADAGRALAAGGLDDGGTVGIADGDDRVALIAAADARAALVHAGRLIVAGVDLTAGDFDDGVAVHAAADARAAAVARRVHRAAADFDVIRGEIAGALVHQVCAVVGTAQAAADAGAAAGARSAHGAAGNFDHAAVFMVARADARAAVVAGCGHAAAADLDDAPGGRIVFIRRRNLILAAGVVGAADTGSPAGTLRRHSAAFDDDVAVILLAVGGLAVAAADARAAAAAAAGGAQAAAAADGQRRQASGFAFEPVANLHAGVVRAADNDVRAA